MWYKPNAIRFIEKKTSSINSERAAPKSAFFGRIK